MTADHEIVCFSTFLLERAEQLAQTDFYQAALVTAQTACEMCCEQACSILLKQRRLDFLQDPLHNLCSNNYNVASPRMTGLYNALSDSRIQDEPFWGAYKHLVEHRNRVVHRGAAVTREEARAHLATARNLIDTIHRRVLTPEREAVVRAAKAPAPAAE
jgi:hypothetical protein